MLIPAFSLRSLFLFVTAASFVCLVIAFAVAGKLWAISMLIGLASFFLAMLLYALAFLVTIPFTLIQFFGREQRPRAPFAQFTPAPRQIATPDELE